MPAPAHILGPGGGPGPIVWVAVGLAIGGMIAWVYGGPGLRRLGMGLTLPAFASVLVLGILAPGAAVRPTYTIEVAYPQPNARVTSPIQVVVCGRQADGSPAALPGPDRVMSVSLDGSQLESISGSTVAVPASAGPHDLRFDILTSEHRSYEPPVEVEEHVVVTGVAPLGTGARCPG